LEKQPERLMHDFFKCVYTFNERQSCALDFESANGQRRLGKLQTARQRTFETPVPYAIQPHGLLGSTCGV
jgi:hypothetical protein